MAEYVPYEPKLPDYMPCWDEIETGYHEYASMIATQESKWHDADEPYSGTFPREFVEWREPMHAARRWLEAHDRTERATAWDEGYDAGCNDEAFEARGIPSDPGSKEYPHANPYRERGDGA